MSNLVKPDYWKHDLVPGGEHKELNTLNLGPTHPATHGIFRWMGR
jgi:NADH:ubiquinone oxidoreductase subunit D